LLSRSRLPLDFDTVTVIYDTSITVYFRSTTLPIPGLVISRKLPEFSAIYLDAKSTQLLKSEHHKAVWSICLNTLTDSPTQGSMSNLCSVRPPASRLARFPSKMTDHHDYHHVYSYVTTSKNDFVPCSNSGHTTQANTDGRVNKLVTLFAFAPAPMTNP